LGKNEIIKQTNKETQQHASDRAKVRARNARWDLNVAIFLFAVLIIVIILLFQDIGVEFVAPIAIFGLAMVWIVGWRRGKQLYDIFYDEELIRLEQESKKKEKVGGKKIKEVIEETIEEKVQKALRERWE
jgi:hypothetical protein